MYLGNKKHESVKTLITKWFINISTVVFKLYPTRTHSHSAHMFAHQIPASTGTGGYEATVMTCGNDMPLIRCLLLHYYFQYWHKHIHWLALSHSALVCSWSASAGLTPCLHSLVFVFC